MGRPNHHTILFDIDTQVTCDNQRNIPSTSRGTGPLNKPYIFLILVF